MKKLNIALLAGGNSSEREVALASAAMILDAFDRSRYNVIPVDVHGLHWTCKGAGDRKVEVDKTDFSVPVGDGKIRFDYAFIMILTERYPDTTFSLLVGSDIPGQITQWKEWRKLLDNYKIYVYPRRGYPAPAADCGFTVLEGAPFEDYSSTEVRTALTEGGGDDMVPDVVKEYIKTQGLWNTGKR